MLPRFAAFRRCPRRSPPVRRWYSDQIEVCRLLGVRTHNPSQPSGAVTRRACRSDSMSHKQVRWLPCPAGVPAPSVMCSNWGRMRL